MSIDVYGVGNAIVDLQFEVSESELVQLDLKKGGMKLVDDQEQKELIKFLEGKEFIQTSGGSAANTIIAISQLGAKAGYDCQVSNDLFGRYYLEEMRALDIELGVKPVVEGQTGTCVILITPDAERTMNTNLGVSAFLNKESVNYANIAKSKCLYLEGYLLSSENGFDVAIKSASHAKENGVMVAFTFSDAFIVDVFRERVISLLKYVDLVFANKTEAEVFLGETDSSAFIDGIQKFVPNCAITLGEEGAIGSFEDSRFSVDACKVRPIDLTGAGDAFAAGFLYSVVNNHLPKRGADLGCFLASKVIEQFGARLKGDLFSETRDSMLAVLDL